MGGGGNDGGDRSEGEVSGMGTRRLVCRSVGVWMVLPASHPLVGLSLPGRREGGGLLTLHALMMSAL